ncbi:hypothetical protein PUN28_004951 [Cardiocondyla obscurior]|uniref:Uncharacterized protein n=1 Tax=Cardiocondyla obscurior TaxID=286306 RepID=A0AAW2GFW2_9HYME
MWVRPPCDLSVPGEYNPGKGPGRKRRVATGVSKKHSGVDRLFDAVECTRESWVFKVAQERRDFESINADG